MYRLKSLTTYVSDDTLAAFEKKRDQLGLSKNQMLKYCVLKALGLVDEAVATPDLQKYLRGK